MDSKTKRWAIIIVDLFIVLGFYFAYTHFRGPLFDADEATREFDTRVIRERIEYKLEGQAVDEERVNMIFRMENRAQEVRSIQLPEGITLLLTDGKEHVFRNRIMETTSFSLSGGEIRSWQRTFAVPEEIHDELMAGFYIDDNRQQLVRVPR